MKLINEHVYGDSGILNSEAKETLAGLNNLRRLALRSALRMRSKSRSPDKTPRERSYALQDARDHLRSSGGYRESIVDRIKDELELARGFAKRL